MLRRITLYCLVGLLVATAATAGDPPPRTDADTVETVEVKQRKTDKPDHASLRFLRDNRAFLRARLDRLRLETHVRRRGAADELDPRHLQLRELAAAIAAARDTVDHTESDLARRQLLTSVGQLRDLEMQLDLMDSLLTDQGRRLGWLESDYLGRQETALVVLVRGDARGQPPSGLVIGAEGESLHVALGETERASLARGGILQIDHRLVEPRAHSLTVSFTGPDWAARPATVLEIDAPRDRLTFLELDLAGLDPREPTAPLTVDVWQR